MRIFLLFIVATVAGLAIWWISRQDPDVERARLTAAAKAASATVGMQKMLRESDVFEFTNVVVSPSQTEDVLEFRAMVIQQGAPRPVYGEAAPNCEDALEAAECWDLVLLEVDGRPYDLGVGAPAPAGDAPDTTETDDTNPETAETGPAEETVVAPPTDPVAGEPALDPVEVITTTTEQPTQDPRPGPIATHEVARPLINARSGPGTTNEVLTQLSGGTQLAQVSASEGWGQFLVLSGEAEGLTVWIAFSILVPVGS